MPPCFPEDFLDSLRQLDRLLFKGINAGFVLFPGSKGLSAGLLHTAFGRQDLDFLDIHQAPDTGGLARSEPNGVTDIVQRLANAIDPTIAKRLINRFGPRNAGVSRVFLIKADPQLIMGLMMFSQPCLDITRLFLAALRCVRSPFLRW